MKNRWLIAASAVGIHISIGSVYAYSAWKMPLENTFGWSATNTTLAFSIAIFFLGLSAAILGRVIEKHGPSRGGLLSAGFFSVGLFGSALACYLENIVLFYLFFGVISGIGLGLGYISPVSTLVKWFPDRRGLATGLAIMGFGFGGLLAIQFIDAFNPAQSEIIVPNGISVYEYQNSTANTNAPNVPTLTEYIQAESLLSSDNVNSAEATIIQATNITDSYNKALIYDKNSIIMAFAGMGVIYLLVMIPSSLYITAPPKDYMLDAVQDSAVAKKMVTREVTAKEALRTPAFYGLWIMLFINVSCGIAVIATAKKMGYEMVHLSVGMASALVMGISLFNGIGRIFWASLSDYIGRSNTYVAFFAIQMIAFPLLANLTNNPVLFVVVTFVILSCYGGGFASIPAYISDLFGLKEMPTIHGFILTAWSLAGVVGPMINAYVYEQTHSYQQSLNVFGGAFVIALIVSILMKYEIKRVKNNSEESVSELELSA